MRFLRTPLESRLLLSIASTFVPRRLRAEWRREWDGEIWWWASTRPGGGQTARERIALAMHCCGALRDACCLRREENELTASLGRLLRRPATCLAGAILMLAVAGSASGGFDHIRRALRSWLQPDAGRLAVLSETGPFMGQRLGVSARKVAYWNRHAQTLEGAAIYSWYPGAARDNSAKVGESFFTFLRARPRIGRVFTTEDTVSCRDCVVLGYDYWKRNLKGDPAIVGRTVTLDGQPARVIGVLARDSWFFDANPAAWSLFEPGKTPQEFPGILTGAVCRLKPGIAPAAAERELRQLARARVSVTPISVILQRPIATLGPLWIAFVLSSGMVALFSSGGRGVKAVAFLFSKAVLGLSFILAMTIEFGGAASTTETGGTTIAAGAGSLWLFLVGSGLVVRWCWSDQRKRCPECLGRLAMAVPAGNGARILLEQSGIEMACPLGHGTLFTSQGGSIAPERRWASLDDSWRDLFVTS